MAANSFRRAVNSATLLLPGRPDIVDDDLFGRDKFSRHLRNLIGNLQRNACHAVQIAVQQIAVIDGQSADVHRQPDVQDMAIGVRANRSAGKYRDT